MDKSNNNNLKKRDQSEKKWHQAQGPSGDEITPFLKADEQQSGQVREYNLQYDGGSEGSQRENDCCCCQCCDYCQCEKLRVISKNETCCCCFPLVVGIWIIYFFIFTILLSLTFDTFFRIFNEYIDSSYIIICFILLIPIYIAVGLFCCYLRSETKQKRKYLWIACLLALFTVLSFYIYTIVYFSNVYPYDDYYKGMGDKDDMESRNYTKSSKKNFILMQVFILILLTIFLAYSTFACYTWTQIADADM